MAGRRNCPCRAALQPERALSCQCLEDGPGASLTDTEAMKENCSASSSRREVPSLNNVAEGPRCRFRRAVPEAARHRDQAARRARTRIERANTICQPDDPATGKLRAQHSFNPVPASSSASACGTCTVTADGDFKLGHAIEVGSPIAIGLNQRSDATKRRHGQEFIPQRFDNVEAPLQGPRPSQTRPAIFQRAQHMKFAEVHTAVGGPASY